MIYASDIGSAVSQKECEILAGLAEGRVALEIGSFWGRSTIAIASVAELVHSVDWHRGEAASEKDKNITESFPRLRDNLLRYGLLDKCVLHMGTSDLICPYLRAGVFGFAFIDADHTYEGCKLDIEQALPLMVPGAPMVFHDYTWPDMGVAEAVDEFWGPSERKVTNSLCIVSAK